MVLLCVGSIVGLLMGVTLLLRHEQLERVNQYLSHWYHADKITEPLDRPRWTERFFYRHHRWVGGVFLVDGVFVLYTFLFHYNVRKVSTNLASGYWGLLDMVVALLIVGSALAAVVGIIMLIRPSALRDIEKISNRWIATDGVEKYFDKMFHSADRHIIRQRKIAGVLLTISSLYVLIVLGNFRMRPAEPPLTSGPGAWFR